ncbi:MAG: hypothetical protein Q8R49_04085, partial [Rhodoferax sp.]|nr:hypothetical protein [Rhodoferax sp.]
MATGWPATCALDLADHDRRGRFCEPTLCERAKARRVPSPTGFQMKVLAGNILTPQGFVRGVLELGDDGRVARIAGEPVTEQEARDDHQALVLPGFIDLHVHGG